MDYKMEILALLLCVVPAFVTTITITSNGNSPEIKMRRGMMMDMQNTFMPMAIEPPNVKPTRIKAKNDNTLTKLSINERYRRLIPYMTFYYANDLATPNVDNGKAIEVEKAELIEARNAEYGHEREPKKIIYPNRNIPIYQGNRLTQHNIASANPTKLFYKGGVPVYQTSSKEPPNFHSSHSDFNIVIPNDFEPSRIIHRPVTKTQNVVYISPTRKPFLNLYSGNSPNIRYYLSQKDPSPKYKLVPYEQTPPVKVHETENVYNIPNKPMIIPKEHNYLKPRPARPHYVYDEVNVRQPALKKQPTIVSQTYYEKQHPFSFPQPEVENGFQPINPPPQYIKEDPRYTTNTPETMFTKFGHQKHSVSPALITIDDLRPNYYEYIVEQTTEQPSRPTSVKNIQLASLLNSLQLNKPGPKPITKENVSPSFSNLLQVLNALKAVPQHNDVELPALSSPKPFILPKIVEIDLKPEVDVQQISEQPPVVRDEDLNEDTYLAHVNPPSQHIDELPSSGGTTQHFPLPVNSDEEGGTPGRPGVDYPTMTIIPPTKFNCKTQRYKGFFADPETRCQVWHYCDLNGGQASFLCPNGTIFSQAGLTCDWWFNVRCNTTTQLYVLNESLYKYILPHSPKFPEDYSGPLVDKYLTLKFKEQEEQFKKNKNRQSLSEKMDSEEDESEETGEDSTERDSPNEEETDVKESDALVEDTAPSVIVETPGTSGNVERLQE